MREDQTDGMTQSAKSEISEKVARASSSPATLAVLEREGALWSEVSQVDDLHHRVRLGGPLRPFWMAALGRALSENQVSIVRAHAKRGHDAQWVAEVLVRPLPGARDPLGLSIIRMVNDTRAPACARETLSVARYALEQTDDHGGTLKLSFETDDRLGLIGELLSSLAALMLFPVEMHIETHEGRVHDCLWLCGQGESRPEPFVERWLKRLLVVEG